MSNNNQIKRLYIERKPGYTNKADELLKDINKFLNILQVESLKIFIRYDIENISDSVYQKAKTTIFSDPVLDNIYEETFPVPENTRVFSSEYQPGQFDQRADSAEKCIRLLSGEEGTAVKSATTYLITGVISDDEFNQIKAYIINPVDLRETGMEKPATLKNAYEEAEDVGTYDGFCLMNEEELSDFFTSLNLAMTFKDFLHIHKYYREEEKRDPTVTEIRVLDTYWSDHCRHTTFSTELADIIFGEGFYRTPIEASYQNYLDTHKELFKGRDDKFVCLMDLAQMAMRKLKRDGKLDDMEETDEINACSVVVPVEIETEDGILTEEWLVMFKNETHNHPTEIEPFGGAATCLGGGIRDPLSGRGYVYQAMRLTGAADPAIPFTDTLKGKLPQRKITRTAASGYSSYGNQIGAPAGLVKEIYHPGYVAKRMELGALVAAAPRSVVVRGGAAPDDVIILLGGRTGRDGCGGATGSSKVHTEDAIETLSAEVQKGDAPTERKIVRLFRRPEASRLIKKCNDFGAGGVSVAIGELAPGLCVNLDKVPQKYLGLDGTELAISESQERMAVVIAPKDVKQFLAYAEEESVETAEVAIVTKEERMVIKWRGKKIVDLSRAFLDTNGAHQETKVFVNIPDENENYFEKSKIPAVAEALAQGNYNKAWFNTLSDLNVCSQKGLATMFDSSAGANNVLMPYGGKYQLTENQTMIAGLPLLKGKTDTVTMMSYGFDPYLSEWSPYHGAVYAVVESIAKIVASGGDYRKIRFSFQEFFRRMSGDPERWSQPFAALLGAYDAQMGFGLPSIGGKDSMSGTFNDIDVPPTLISFAVNTAKIQHVISPELKTPGNLLVHIFAPRDEYEKPIYEKVGAAYLKISELIASGEISSAYALSTSGLAAAVSKMAFGNKLGVRINEEIKAEDLFKNNVGDILIETAEEVLDKLAASDIKYAIIGTVTDDGLFSGKDINITLEEALENWTVKLEEIFPAKLTCEAEGDIDQTSQSAQNQSAIKPPIFKADSIYLCKNRVVKPTVFIPVLHGTNGEYEMAGAFERAGAKVVSKVFRSLTTENIRTSYLEYVAEIDKAQILVLPGGFSTDDEADGSAKFYNTIFQNEYLQEAVTRLLNERDGLILGIGTGFQALLKLGLLPFGEFKADKEAGTPALTHNTGGKHLSMMAYTKVVSDKSPWLKGAALADTYVSPASHTYGRFVASDEWVGRLFAEGQVAACYTAPTGNINGSAAAIEGITSPDGRIFGKMLHSERYSEGMAINIDGQQDMKIFESGVRYFN
ncbi:MAG: phosphoribosylformylglycinamidine synthase [Lachnospiraceae bacterium]|nr:phosphoribosylformylglycinamidine synthase [Lachnospiraceae bacterium]